MKYEIEGGVCPFDRQQPPTYQRQSPTDDVPENDEGGVWPHFLHCPGCGIRFTPTGLIVGRKENV